MLVSEGLSGKVAVSCLSFSYSDEYDEAYEDVGKEDDFENVDDSVLNEFDDDIYGDELDEDDTAEDDMSDVEDGFDDDIYGDITDTDNLD